MLCLMCACHRSNSNKMYLVDKGCMTVLLGVINDKNDGQCSAMLSVCASDLP